MSKKYYPKVFKLWYKTIYGCVSGGPIPIIGSIDPVEHHVSIANHKGVIL